MPKTFICAGCGKIRLLSVPHHFEPGWGAFENSCWKRDRVLLSQGK